MDHSRTFLAWRLLVVLRHVVSFAQLYYGVVFLLSELDDANFSKFAFLRKGDVQIAKDKSVIELLRDFAGKKCAVLKDHFSSVFALCEKRENLIVDYASEKLDLVYHVLQMSRKKICICSVMLAFKTVMGEIASGQKDVNGHFLEFDCIGFDAWFDSIDIAEAEDIGRCERFSGGSSFIWSVDGCSTSRELRSRLAVRGQDIIRHTVHGTFPCYAPEADHPRRTVPLSEELWEVPLYRPDQANRRVQYVRGEGFSAKLGDDRFTYTIRIALWMLERWIQGADHAERDYTDKVREMGHGSKYRTKDLKLCPRAETRQVTAWLTTTTSLVTTMQMS